MPYELNRLAAGSYDLLLDGIIVGSVVRAVTCNGDGRGWHAELLDDPPPERRPHPFSEVEQRFKTLEAVTSWLGGALILDEITLP